MLTKDTKRRAREALDADIYDTVTDPYFALWRVVTPYFRSLPMELGEALSLIREVDGRLMVEVRL